MGTDTIKPSVAPHNWTDGGERVLILRRCNNDGTSYGGFPWPQSGMVEAPDWSSEPECGGGLHGWPWGMGIGEGKDYDIIDDRWIVFACRPDDVIGALEGGWKCKSKCGEVVYCGSFAAAWAMINSGRHRLIEAMSRDGAKDIASGYGSNAASSGYGSHAASSGYGSNAASSGYGSNAASSGDYSNAASSGDYSKAASSGDYSNAASSGDHSNAASSGDYSNAASSGDRSHAASSGDRSHAASSGDRSNAAQSGKSGIAAALGTDTKAKAGPLGLVIACEWVPAEERYRAAVGYVGEDGIEAGTWYRASGGKLVKAD